MTGWTKGAACFATALLGGAAAAQPGPRAGAPYILRDGSIAIVTSAKLAGAVRAIDAVFLKTHPGVRFTVLEGDNYSAMATLTFDKSLVAPLGCEYTRIGLGDNLKIAAEPIGIRIAHATLAPGPGVPMLGVAVNRANPLTSLTLGQVTRLFAVGGSSGDLVTWGQAGVTGPLADREVHPVGPMSSDYQESEDPQAGEYLSTDKLGGLNMNHRYTGLTHYADVIARVREDPAAIGIVALNQPVADLKLLAIKSETGASSQGSAADVAAGRYALDRFVYLYLRVGKGTPPDEFAREYVRIALSDEAQRAIAAEATGYIALSAGEVAEERGKLDR